MIDLDLLSLNKMQVGMGVVLIIVVVFLLLLLWVWHRSSRSTVDLKDLVCRDGRLDEKKFTRFGAWIVSTWGFVYMVMDAKLSEWYFVGYMGVWVSNAILDKYLTNRSTAAKDTTTTQ